MLDEQEIVRALDRAGMEIEQVIYSKPIDERVIVCSVKKVVQHPGADRLKLVDVETGEGQCRVVCGAPNVREGLKVPFAQIGAVLPSGDTISRAKLRGEVSEGMLCSAAELGLGEDHSGLLELDPSLEPGTALASLYPADTMIDLKTPANRFDVLSVLGMAREVAAMTGSELKDASPAPLTWSDEPAGVLSDMQADAFNLVKLSVDSSKASPDWMQARLRAVGMRPLGLIVDITNYVMLEYGQPLHAYDAERTSLPFGVRLPGPADTSDAGRR
jgi:phenylalanyl-tRNA synthetase beta chain